MHLNAISFCPSSFFSTRCLGTNIPSVVPLPCLNSSCSSTISPFTTALILPSRIRSSNFNIWLGNVMPLYITDSFTSPFVYHIRTISPVFHSSVNFASLLQVFRNVLLTIFQLAQPPPASLLALHQRSIYLSE